MKWGDLVRAEPELGNLELAIKSVRPNDKRFCANAVWYGYGPWAHRGFKARMQRLAGWDARNPALRTQEAYDLAYDHLYSLLPDCRGCSCF